MTQPGDTFPAEWALPAALWWRDEDGAPRLLSPDEYGDLIRDAHSRPPSYDWGAPEGGA
jgi:hypothetical protein